MTRPALSPELRRHLPAPDYERPLLQIGPSQRARLLDILSLLYGREVAEGLLPELQRLMRVYYATKTPEMIDADRAFDPATRFDER
ncbi:MAG: sugar phosphorylase, partial [Candidatus Binatia bacterium]